MHFAVVGNLWWGLLALPLILMYFMRARRVPFRVPSLMLWRRVELELQGDPAIKKLERSGLLILQLLVLALLVLALSEPYREGKAIAEGRVTIIIDASGSMRAHDISPNRFEVAKAQALEIIDALPPSSQARVLVAAERPVVVCGLTSERVSLSAAIARVCVTDCAGAVRETIELALSLDGGDDAVCYLISDGAALGDEPLPGAGKLSVHLVGSAVDNVGIVDFSVRKNVMQGGRCQAFARVGNYSALDAHCRIDLWGQGVLIDTRTMTLAEGAERSFLFDDLLFDDGLFEVRIQCIGTELQDMLVADDRAYAFVAPISCVRVGLAVANDFFYRRALQALPHVEVVDVEGSAELAGVDWAIVEGDQIPDGPSFVLVQGPTESCPGVSVCGALEGPAFGLWARTHALMRHMSLEDHVLSSALALDCEPWLSPVAEENHGRPLIAAGQFNGRLFVVLAFLPHETDLPLSSTFPLFLANCVDWYRETVLLPSHISAGTSFELPGGFVRGAPTSLIDANGDVRPLRLTGGRLCSEPLREAGLYRLMAGRKNLGTLSVSFSGSAESDLRSVVVPDEYRAGRGPVRERSHHPLGWFVALLALVLSVFELLLWASGRGVR